MPAGARPTPTGADARPERGRARADGEGPAAPEPVHARITVDGEVFTVVEGDLLLDEDQRQVYELERRVGLAQHQLVARTALTGALVTPGGGGTSALVAVADTGRVVRWAPGVELTYCVLRRSFPSQEHYGTVVANMARATQDWMDTCGVTFRHVPELDDSASTRPEGVVFPVRGIDANGAFIASAFFPTDAGTRRRVLIDPSYFTAPFDGVGVLRHELGHTLGFRHEHIRSGAPAICPDESTVGTVELSDYDPQSVMHYFCGGVGSRTLEISGVDRAGSQLVYGPPLAEFVLVEP